MRQAGAYWRTVGGLALCLLMSSPGVSSAQTASASAEQLAQEARQGNTQALRQLADLANAGNLQAAALSRELYAKDISLPEAPIHEAAKAGALATVKGLLDDTPALVNAVNYLGGTPLHIAALFGRREVVQLLVERQADINAMTLDRITPLHASVFTGQVDIVKQLLAAGADASTATADGVTALHVASRKDIAELLLAHDADPNMKAADGTTPLLRAINGGYADVVAALVSRGADVNAASAVGITPLHVAAYLGHTAMVEQLLAHGADVNAQTAEGHLPIQGAGYAHHDDIVQLLVAHGATGAPAGEPPAGPTSAAPPTVPAATPAGVSPRVDVIAALTQMASAMELYRLDTGTYPSTAQGLNALLTPPDGIAHWRGPYLERKIFKDGQQLADPWGHPYVYRFPGHRAPADYDLGSLGPDGAESGDDIILPPETKQLLKLE